MTEHRILKNPTIAATTVFADSRYPANHAAYLGLIVPAVAALRATGFDGHVVVGLQGDVARQESWGQWEDLLGFEAIELSTPIANKYHTGGRWQNYESWQVAVFCLYEGWAKIAEQYPDRGILFFECDVFFMEDPTPHVMSRKKMAAPFDYERGHGLRNELLYVPAGPEARLHLGIINALQTERVLGADTYDRPAQSLVTCRKNFPNHRFHTEESLQILDHLVGVDRLDMQHGSPDHYTDSGSWLAGTYLHFAGHSVLKADKTIVHDGVREIKDRIMPDTAPLGNHFSRTYAKQFQSYEKTLLGKSSDGGGSTAAKPAPETTPTRKLMLTWASGETFCRGLEFWLYRHTMLRTRQTCEHWDSVVMTHDMPADIREQLATEGIKVVDVDPSRVSRIFHDRHVAVASYLSTVTDLYDEVVVTDGRDVIVQADPFISPMLDKYDVCLFGEGPPHSEVTWAQRDWSALHQDLDLKVPMPLNSPVLNGGTYYGRPHELSQLFRSLWSITAGTARTGTDQAVLNYYFHNLRGSDRVGAFSPFDSRLCFSGCGASLLPPQVPFDIRDGKVCTQDGEPYALVHQWDRMPEVRKLNMVPDDYPVPFLGYLPRR